MAQIKRIGLTARGSRRILQGCAGFKELRGNNGNMFLTAG
jgi:hypothetical protein